MSQHDPQAQQGSSTVKSFALQFDSDSEAGSVLSNGIDSPPQERRAEERDKDSARRATLAALGLVPGPPPPVSGTPTKPNSGTMTPRNNVLSPQISPSASFETFPDQSAVRKAQGLDSPPGGMARALQGPSQAVPPAQPSSISRSGFGVSPFSKVSENIAGLTKPASLQSSDSSKEQHSMMSSGGPPQQGKQMEGFRESNSTEEKPLTAKALGGQSPPKSRGSSDSESSGLARVPSSPFEAAQSMPIDEQPFVSPVPPIRTKAPSNSPQSSTSRGSSRFQDRYTSPTTTRIVDELLDEVVAHRLTPRDISGSGRNNEPPMRPRGRSNSGDDRDLPRIGKQDNNKGSTRQEFSSFSDVGHAQPAASGAIDLETSFSKGSLGPQSLSPGPEGRSSSIGEELKMVMKSERAGRLARDSAEILVGDRPGEFTVVTQEGSSIPVDVSDLTESTSSKRDSTEVHAAQPELQQPGTAHSSANPAPAAAYAAAASKLQEAASAQGPADPKCAKGSDPEPLGQEPEDTKPAESSEPAPQPAVLGPDHSPAAKKSTWLGSMMAVGTAALGLKGGGSADAGGTRSLQPAAQAAASSGAPFSVAPDEAQKAASKLATGSTAPVAGQEAAPASTMASVGPTSAQEAVPAEIPDSAAPQGGQKAGLAANKGAAGGQQEPPILDIASTEPRANPSPVSAFGSEVSVQPVSVATTDSSPIEGNAAESASAVASPPVAQVQAPEAAKEEDAFADAQSLECVQKESSLAGKPLQRSHVSQPVTPPASHDVEIKRGTSAFQEALALEELHHRKQPEVTSPTGSASRTASDAGSTVSIESATFLGTPMPGTISSTGPVRMAAGGPGAAPVTAERTRSEAAFLEAMPLELPHKKKPAPPKPAVSSRTESDVTSPDEALPLEKTRPQKRSSPKLQSRPQVPAGQQQSPSWEQAVPLESTRRRPSSKKVPVQSAKGQGQSASAWEEAAPLERNLKKSNRSTPVTPPRTKQSSSPTSSIPSRSSRRSSRTVSADVDITEEAQLQDPSLDRSDSLDQRLPLMANLSGDYSLESSGTERYDLYIDRAAAYDKAQQSAQKSAHLANKPAPTKQASSSSLDSATATVIATTRRMPHMGGIAAGTQPGGSSHGHHDEPDIDMPDPETLASDESDSDEAEGNSIYYPSKSKSGEKGEGDNSMKELVGVSHVSPPPSAFASAQPPRSVFADAQMPASDSEADPDSARSHRRSADAHRKATQVGNTNNLAGKGRGKHQPAKKKGFCSCFG